MMQCRRTTSSLVETAGRNYVCVCWGDRDDAYCKWVACGCIPHLSLFVDIRDVVGFTMSTDISQSVRSVLHVVNVG